MIQATKLDDVAGPLSGIRVIELGQVIAGPFCAQMLGDLGAEVIKVEPPGKGDVLRQWGHADVTGDSLWWSVAGRNKRSITVDLRTPSGHQLVRGVADEQVVEEFGRLNEAGMEGRLMGFVDYNEEMKYFGKKVLPLMKEAGLRH